MWFGGCSYLCYWASSGLTSGQAGSGQQGLCHLVCRGEGEACKLAGKWRITGVWRPVMNGRRSGHFLHSWSHCLASHWSHRSLRSSWMCLWAWAWTGGRIEVCVASVPVAETPVLSCNTFTLPAPSAAFYCALCGKLARSYPVCSQFLHGSPVKAP